MTRLDRASIILGVFGVVSVGVNAGQALADGRSPSGRAVMLRTEPVPVSALRVSIPIAGEQS